MKAILFLLKRKMVSPGKPGVGGRANLGKDSVYVISEKHLYWPFCLLCVHYSFSNMFFYSKGPTPLCLCIVRFYYKKKSILIRLIPNLFFFFFLLPVMVMD